ncbi:MAG: hypothetical protein ACYDCB_01400 [Candidatus Dormibacteria bacterium]
MAERRSGAGIINSVEYKSWPRAVPRHAQERPAAGAIRSTARVDGVGRMNPVPA